MVHPSAKVSARTILPHYVVYKRAYLCMCLHFFLQVFPHDIIVRYKKIHMNKWKSMKFRPPLVTSVNSWRPCPLIVEFVTERPTPVSLNRIDVFRWWKFLGNLYCTVILNRITIGPQRIYVPIFSSSVVLTSIFVFSTVYSSFRDEKRLSIYDFLFAQWCSVLVYVEIKFFRFELVEFLDGIISENSTTYSV